ncbi:MAG TPA: ABC transporter transmembrane domain-containing protein, partial [Longimicrobium sp.]
MKELRALLPYLRRYRGQIAWGIVMVLAANALSVLSLEYVKIGVDALGRPGTTQTTVFYYAALSLGVAILSGAGRYGMREILNGVSRRVELDLRDDFFGQLLRLDAGFYARHPTGDIMSRATSDIAAVRMVAGPAYMYLVNTVVFSVFALTRMAWIDVWMTVASLIPMILLPPVTIWFGNVIHHRFEGIQEQQGVMATMAQENLAGQRIVKAYGQEEYQSRRFRDLSHDYLRRNVDLARTSGLFYPTLGLLAGLAMVVALWIGGRGIMRGDLTNG